MARSDIMRPPIVPDASGNQKLSCASPTTNGIKPKTVDNTVNIIDVIFTLKALK
jgi:hypothetical protein